ncbi:MAG: hypothetical protein ACR2NP_10490 [Pirellulaceae bacterium]
MANPATGWKISRAAGVVALLLCVLLINHGISACLVCIVPYRSLLDRVELSDRVFIGRAVDESRVTWQVEQGIKGIVATTPAQLITIDPSKSKNVQPGELHLLRYSPLDETWIIEKPVDGELTGFLSRALWFADSLNEDASVRDQAQYYRYFLPYLEHDNPAIADSAYNKLAAAPYNILQLVGAEADPGKLISWIEKPHIAKNRGSLYITMLGICGGQNELAQLQQWLDQRWNGNSSSHLAPILTAHAELNGEETLCFIEESYFLSRERTLGEIIAAVDALRLHGSADSNIGRERVLASFHLLLRERPQLLELIIDDCKQWEDWSIAPQLAEIYLSDKQPWNNQMIVDFMRDCPEPAAKQFLVTIAADADD